MHAYIHVCCVCCVCVCVMTVRSLALLSTKEDDTQCLVFVKLLVFNVN